MDVNGASLRSLTWQQVRAGLAWKGCRQGRHGSKWRASTRMSQQICLLSHELRGPKLLASDTRGALKSCLGAYRELQGHQVGVWRHMVRQAGGKQEGCGGGDGSVHKHVLPASRQAGSKQRAGHGWAGRPAHAYR